jgi:hypothetical protein
VLGDARCVMLLETAPLDILDGSVKDAVVKQSIDRLRPPEAPASLLFSTNTADASRR